MTFSCSRIARNINRSQEEVGSNPDHAYVVWGATTRRSPERQKPAGLCDTEDDSELPNCTEGAENSCATPRTHKHNHCLQYASIFKLIQSHQASGRPVDAHFECKVLFSVRHRPSHLGLRRTKDVEKLRFACFFQARGTAAPAGLLTKMEFSRCLLSNLLALVKADRGMIKTLPW